jgi:hypothetical protein
MSATTTTAPSAAPSLRELLLEGASASEIAAHLEALSPADRVKEVLRVTGKDVGRLYEAVAAAPPVSFEDIVPASAAEGETVIFEGRNSLPLFSRFQKRFARLGSSIVGLNHQTMSFLTGPGYFIVKGPSAEGACPNELFFDYTVAPSRVPEGWPAYKANDKGFSRSVYMNMQDYMRRVCQGVVVGKAYKLGVDQGAFFSLSRA